jgi:hypothetical protein
MRPWAPTLPLLSDGFIPAKMTCLHASLSSAFLCLRQAVIWSASGMNALHRRSASGVQARRASGVPCAMTEAGEAINDSKATRASAFSRRRIDLSSPIRKTSKAKPGSSMVYLMTCPRSPSRSLVSRRGRCILNGVAIHRTSLSRFIRVRAESARTASAAGSAPGSWPG